MATKTTKLSAREFNQDVSRAKRAAKSGPVIITDRGRESHVLLSIAAYRKLKGEKSKSESLADLFGDDAAAAIEFDAPRMRDGWLRPADFS